jgi:hypothetical protein
MSIKQLSFLVFLRFLVFPFYLLSHHPSFNFIHFTCKISFSCWINLLLQLRKGETMKQKLKQADLSKIYNWITTNASRKPKEDSDIEKKDFIHPLSLSFIHCCCWNKRKTQKTRSFSFSTPKISAFIYRRVKIERKVLHFCEELNYFLTLKLFVFLTSNIEVDNKSSFSCISSYRIEKMKTENENFSSNS